MMHFSIILGGRYEVFGSGTGPILLTELVMNCHYLNVVNCLVNTVSN